MNLLDVAASDPSVRPWNEPRNAMMFIRFVWYFASLRAASLASVPELPKNERTSPSIGTMAAISSASCTWGS